jgi:transcriptional regulator of heat shock response
MVNEDIIGGLRSALTRGYSLDEAVLSFLNAGYKQKEIEEASQILQSQITGTDISAQPIWTLEEEGEIKHQPELEYPIKEKPVILQKQFSNVPPKQVVTKGVAAYTNQNTSRITTITIILAILLVVLLGILGLMYLFRTQIIDFFNSLF